MKIQISFDLTELEKSLAIAQQIAEFADILEVGSVLIYRYGTHAIEKFRSTFNDKIILADAKLVDRTTQIVSLFATAGADWITVMSGTTKNVIHTACTIAHEHGKKIMLDLLDSCSLGQSAMDAKGFGVDALLFHKPYEEEDTLKVIDDWNLVRDNTQLPIFISTKINEEMIEKIKAISADGVILGDVITEADNPQEKAAYFKQIFSSH